MTEEKWQDIKGNVQDKFEILENKTEPLEYKTGLDQKQQAGEKEVIVFKSPMGKVKLEYHVKPLILDKKEHYSRRMGTSSTTEYVFSDSEFSRRMEAYKWNENYGEWEKIDESMFK